MSSSWKLGIVGGTGRIACAVVCDLAQKAGLGRGEILLYGRSAEKLKRNLTLIERVGGPAASRIKVSGTFDLDEAIRGADVILYNATAGLIPSGGYLAFGISQGAHILHVAQRIAELAPQAWFLVDTNPPDVPLGAVRHKFGLRRLLGLCNASDIFQRLISAYLGCAESDVGFSEMGVNHEVWYLDILRKGVSVYEDLRQSLPVNYDPTKLTSAYLESFPEWRVGFPNNIALMSATGFLTTPVGGPQRFRGLPVPSAEMWGGAKRPTDADYADLVSRNAGAEEILKVIRRCGGGIPVYVARVISALLSDTLADESVQVLNEGILADQPETALLQVNCRISRQTVTPPQGVRPPDYIAAVLAARIRQNDLAARALAEQDECLLRQAMLVCPERVDIPTVEKTVRGQERVEPHMQLN